MKPKLILGFALVLSGGLFGCEKADEQVESVMLSSGEILENHTHCESGWPSGVRLNQLFLKNPATGTSERVDSNGNLDYGYDDSLLVKFPHPQEFIYGDEKVLVVGSYLCQRLKFNNVPYWNIMSIVPVAEAETYLKSFLPTNNVFYKSPAEMGLQGSVPFVFDSLDLTNNVLTLRKQIPKGFDNWQQFQHIKKLTHDFSLWDEFPPYLVYSAIDFKGGSTYQFPLKFDIARTKAKNGSLWDKP
jgi:hypothetical protein